METAAESQPPHHRRLLQDGTLSAVTCARLSWLLSALAHHGHIEYVDAITAPEMAHADPRLLMELVAAREALLQAVEAAFDCEAELYPEWTGLIRWRAGAHIDWHSDSGRDYLRQREYSAVAYLNTQGDAFDGGSLRFAAGEPSAVAPVAGRLVAYSAGEVDRHCVDAVTRGARDTFTMWFTRDPTHSEDAKILQLLSQQLRPCGLPPSLWQARQSGGGAAGEGASCQQEPARDVRVRRLAQLGLSVELPTGIDGRVGLWPAGGGSDDASSSGCHWCTSLQEASLLGHWAAARRRQGGDGLPAEQVGAGGGCCAEWSLADLQEAAADLGAHLESAGAALQNALPVWRAHGFLVTLT